MRLLPIVAALLLTGCASFSWRRDSRFSPPPKGAVEELAVGESGLQRCLDLLGAPLWVWEYGGDGVAMAYGWQHERNWGVNVSVPITRDFAGSVDYTDIDSRMRGVVLFFDADLRLTGLRPGLLRDLTIHARRSRPSAEVD